jgi:MFS family permease
MALSRQSQQAVDPDDHGLHRHGGAVDGHPAAAVLREVARAGGLVVGTLISSFAVAQLISAPMWGRFSDAYGRRPALLVGLGAR